jgi:SAM-dependent methyltransferase
LQKLARDPSIAYKLVKSFALDQNLRKDKNRDYVFSQSIPALGQLAQFSTRANQKSIAEWLPLDEGCDTEDLARLFTERGSDKATHHDYYKIYASVLTRTDPLHILEIGLGTNNLDVPSNMGVWGKPGASLRAFRDWARHAQVYGADVDDRVLFQEERIVTFWVDQTKPQSLAELRAQLAPRSFDLIIDDGLHLPHANLNTINALLHLLKPSGTLVIEDIEPIHEQFWSIAQRLLAPTYDSIFAQMSGGCVFVIRRRAR